MSLTLNCVQSGIKPKEVKPIAHIPFKVISTQRTNEFIKPPTVVVPIHSPRGHDTFPITKELERPNTVGYINKKDEVPTPLPPIKKSWIERWGGLTVYYFSWALGGGAFWYWFTNGDRKKTKANL